MRNPATSLHGRLAFALRNARVSDRRAWRQARTIEDLAELTAGWLEGRIGYLPGYIGRPAAETEPLIGHLVGYNRHGYLTTGSQPGITPADGSGQRAWVSGFCDDETAAAIQGAAFHTDLIVLATPPGTGDHTRIAVTTIDGAEITWVGNLPADYIDEYYALDCPDVIDALKSTWQIAVIDPRWGRNSLLWDTVAGALESDGRCVP